jgi:hypothetical protein
MSLAKNDLDEQIIEITSGNLIVDPYGSPQVNFISGGSVNIDSWVVGTGYIYVKVATNWLNGSDLRNTPELTIQENNFAGNEVRMPATDFGSFFFPVGEVVITEVDNEKQYSLDQIANDNASLPGIDLPGLITHVFFAAKSSDSDQDTSQEIFISRGTAKLPDKSFEELSTIRQSGAITQTQYANIRMTSSLNADGFPENYAAVIQFSTTPPADTNTAKYYTVSTIVNGQIYQDQLGNFISEGRVW